MLLKDIHTGLVARYPESHEQLFKNLVRVDSEEPCLDCVFIPDEEEEKEVDEAPVQLNEPEPRKRSQD